MNPPAFKYHSSFFRNLNNFMFENFKLCYKCLFYVIINKYVNKSQINCLNLVLNLLFYFITILLVLYIYNNGYLAVSSGYNLWEILSLKSFI